MTDSGTKKKRTVLTVAVVALVVLFPLGAARGTIDDNAGEVVAWLLGLGVLGCALAFVVGAPWAAFLYWRDWYRS